MTKNRAANSVVCMFSAMCTSRDQVHMAIRRHTIFFLFSFLVVRWAFGYDISSVYWYEELIAERPLGMLCKASQFVMAYVYLMGVVPSSSRLGLRHGDVVSNPSVAAVVLASKHRKF